MPRKVKATAEMVSFLGWGGEVPDDVPEDEIWYWGKHNIDGGEFYEPDPLQGDWIWGSEVEILEDEDDS